jgi:hypothetical protein
LPLGGPQVVQGGQTCGLQSCRERRLAPKCLCLKGRFTAYTLLLQPELLLLLLLLQPELLLLQPELLLTLLFSEPALFGP